jgi:hypothetical protein
MHEIMVFRPPKSKGAGDIHLPRITSRLNSLIETAQRAHICRAIRLDRDEVFVLAMSLAELGEDLHNDIGIWAAYETHNTACFGVPLPLTPCRDSQEPQDNGITRERVLHHIWVFYMEVLGGALLPPDHEGLAHIANETTKGLKHCYATVPKDSGVKQFLARPIQFGWDLKRKLVWLGTNSYMFRLFFESFKARRSAKDRGNPISAADDFVCQVCTEWSGLSANDLLARVLDLSEGDREDLLNWSYRHTGAFVVRTTDPDVMVVRNVVSNRDYRVRMNVEKNPFSKDALAVGSLVPWRGEWLWSGTQEVLGTPTDEMIKTIRESFVRVGPALFYRLCPDKEERARRFSQDNRNAMVRHFGGPLAVFPDKTAFEEGMEQAHKTLTPDTGEQELRELREKRGLPEDGGKAALSKNLREHTRPIAAFFNSNGGTEIVECFDEIETAFKRIAPPMSDHDRERVASFVVSENTSPDFVRHMVERHGAEAIRDSFVLGSNPPDYWLEYLLRRFKGDYFKKQYPSIVLV